MGYTSEMVLTDPIKGVNLHKPSGFQYTSPVSPLALHFLIPDKTKFLQLQNTLQSSDKYTE